MYIVAYETGWKEDTFKLMLKGHKLLFESGPVPQKIHVSHRNADVLAVDSYSQLDAKTLKQFLNVKLIVTTSTGYDHIDIAFCRDYGITVCNVPGYAGEAVAEHVFALLLALSRRIVAAVERTRKGGFSWEGLEGIELKGKTLGVVGTGAIGRRVIAIARGFGMEVVTYDMKPDKQAAAMLGFSYISLDDLLLKADVITLHVPGTGETRNLISRREFSKMKNGVVLINTARGTIVDTVALLEALASKKVAGAGLDVLPEESLMDKAEEVQRAVAAGAQNVNVLFANHLLIHHPNVIVTPHIAFNTHDAYKRLIATTIDNIIAFLEGRPQNVVHIE